MKLFWGAFVFFALTLSITTQASSGAAFKGDRRKISEATASGDIEKLQKYLVNDGGSLLYPYNGLTPLMVAVDYQQYKAAEYILEQIDSIATNAFGGDGRTALMLAVDLNLCGEATRDTVGRSVDADISDSVFRSAGSFVELLLRHHADPLIQDSVGNTSLHKSVMTGNPSCFFQLFQYSSEGWDTRNEDDENFLHVAVRSNKIDIVKLFVKHSFEIVGEKLHLNEEKTRKVVRGLVNAKNMSEQSVMDIAVSEGFNEIERELQNLLERTGD